MRAANCLNSEQYMAQIDEYTNAIRKQCWWLASNGHKDCGPAIDDIMHNLNVIKTCCFKLGQPVVKASYVDNGVRMIDLE